MKGNLFYAYPNFKKKKTCIYFIFLGKKVENESKGNIVNKVDEEMVKPTHKEMWKNLGILTDKICFVLYGIIFALLILILMVIIPKAK